MLHLFARSSHCNVEKYFFLLQLYHGYLLLYIYFFSLLMWLLSLGNLESLSSTPVCCYSVHLKWTPWEHFLMRNSLWRAGSALPTVWQALSCFSPAESILKGLLMQLSPWHHSLSCLNIMGLRRHMRTHSWLLHDVDEWSRSFTALHVINSVVNYKLTIHMTEMICMLWLNRGELDEKKNDSKLELSENFFKAIEDGRVI